MASGETSLGERSGYAGRTRTFSLKTLPDVSTLLLVAFGLLAVFAPNALRPRIGKVDYVVVFAVLMAAGCSTFLSLEPLRGLRFLVYVCLNMFLLLLASSVTNRNKTRLVAICIGLFGVLHLAGLLLSSQLAGHVSAKSIVSYTQMATLVVPNDALILGLCLPSLAFCFLDEEVRLSAAGYLVVTLYVSLSVFVSHLLQSKTALLSVFMALLALAVMRFLDGRSGWLRARRVVMVIGSLGLLLLLSVVVWYVGNQSTTRLSLWSEASTAHSSISGVLFGVGPNTFLFNPFAVESAYDKGDFMIPWVHNLYLEAYFEQGLLGLFAITSLTLIPLWRGLRIRDQNVRTLILATTVTFCLVSLFEVTLTRRFYFALLALLYGLSAAHSQEVSNE